MRQLLNEHHGSLDVNARDLQAKVLDTALVYAVTHDDLEAVRFLLRRGADPNITVEGSQHVLLFACHNVDIVRALITSGADVNHRSADLFLPTALFAAASKGHAQVVRVLLKAGADPSVRDLDGLTATDHAVAAKANDAIAAFKEAAASAAAASESKRSFAGVFSVCLASILTTRSVSSTWCEQRRPYSMVRRGRPQQRNRSRHHGDALAAGQAQGRHRCQRK